MSWSTSELRVRLALWNWFKPSSKIFYWLFQGSTSFVDLLCFFLSCVCNAFVCFCLFVPCGYLLGKGWPLGSHLWCLTVSLSLSHWYPRSGVVLDCIDSWSLHPYLLLFWIICSLNYREVEIEIYNPLKYIFLSKTWLGRIGNNLTQMVVGWPSTKVAKISMICQIKQHSGRSQFLLCIIKVKKKIIFKKQLGQFGINLP